MTREMPGKKVCGWLGMADSVRLKVFCDQQGIKQEKLITQLLKEFLNSDAVAAVLRQPEAQEAFYHQMSVNCPEGNPLDDGPGTPDLFSAERRQG